MNSARKMIGVDVGDTLFNLAGRKAKITNTIYKSSRTYGTWYVTLEFENGETKQIDWARYGWTWKKENVHS